MLNYQIIQNTTGLISHQLVKLYGFDFLNSPENTISIISAQMGFELFHLRDYVALLALRGLPPQDFSYRANPRYFGILIPIKIYIFLFKNVDTYRIRLLRNAFQIQHLILKQGTT